MHALSGLPILRNAFQWVCTELKEWVESINAGKQQYADAFGQILPRVAATLNATQKAQLVAFRQKVFSTDLTDAEKQVLDYDHFWSTFPLTFKQCSGAMMLALFAIFELELTNTDGTLKRASS